MIRRKEEMLVEIKSRMRDGNGEVELCHILEQKDLKGHARLVARITLKEGCSIGVHRHDNEEEIYYILQGTATVTDDGITKILYPGDAMLTGDGSSHSIANNETKPLVLLAIILLY